MSKAFIDIIEHCSTCYQNHCIQYGNDCKHTKHLIKHLLRCGNTQCEICIEMREMIFHHAASCERTICPVFSCNAIRMLHSDSNELMAFSDEVLLLNSLKDKYKSIATKGAMKKAVYRCGKCRMPKLRHHVCKKQEQEDLTLRASEDAAINYMGCAPDNIVKPPMSPNLSYRALPVAPLTPEKGNSDGQRRYLLPERAISRSNSGYSDSDESTNSTGTKRQHREHIAPTSIHKKRSATGSFFFNEEVLNLPQQSFQFNPREVPLHRSSSLISDCSEEYRKSDDDLSFDPLDTVVDNQEFDVLSDCISEIFSASAVLNDNLDLNVVINEQPLPQAQKMKPLPHLVTDPNGGIVQSTSGSDRIVITQSNEHIHHMVRYSDEEEEEVFRLLEDISSQA